MVLGLEAELAEAFTAASKRAIHAKTRGKWCGEMRVEGSAPFRVRSQWKGQTAVYVPTSLAYFVPLSQTQNRKGDKDITSS